MNAKTQKETQTKLAKGLLDTIILEQLQKESLHGYQLILNIRKGFGVYFGPSTIYPLLGQLEKKGYVQSAWNMTSDRPRKEYTLTSQGKSLLCITESTLIMMCQKITQQTEMKTHDLTTMVMA
jgi:PadR family transcriptional regulator, regulatory protein PadR